MEKIRLNVEGMHCRSCEKIIEKTALSIEGVESAQSDFVSEELTIKFDENKTNIDEIIKAINSKGYDCHCTTVEPKLKNQNFCLILNMAQEKQ